MALPPVIDPHIHLWSPRSTPRKVSPVVKLFGWSPALSHRLLRLAFPRSALDFVGKVDHVAADYLPAHYRADAAGLPLRGVVHVEASWTAWRPLQVAEETRWLEQLPGTELILGMVGAASLESPQLDAQLDAHAQASPRFRGVRDKLASSPHRGVMDWSRVPGMLESPAWQRGYARLGERGLRFDAWMYAPQLSAFRELAARHDETAVVIDHVGTPIGLGGPHGGLSPHERAELAARWRQDLAALAELPHVHLKLSGLTMPVVGWGLHEEEPVDVDGLVGRLGPHLRAAIERFGPERCMFASNFPMDKVSASLSQLYEAFDRITADYSETEREQLFAGTAARFYELA